MRLTPENYHGGFLIDADLMAGVTEKPAAAGTYIGYVLRHETGEYLGYREYPTLEAALAEINAIPREWDYESTHTCGEGKCGNNRSGNCRIGGCGSGAKPARAPDPSR